ncbi:unnamed protein product [Urochloa humidicola]
MKHKEVAAKLLDKLKEEESKALHLGKELKLVTAQLKVFRAAQDDHTTTIRLVRGDLEAAKAEHAAMVLQLEKELEAERNDQAAVVKAITAESLIKLMDMEHKFGMMLSNEYATGLRHMRELVLALYPDDVDPAKLTPEALSARFIPEGFAPRQAPIDH